MLSLRSQKKFPGRKKMFQDIQNQVFTRLRAVFFLVLAMSVSVGVFASEDKGEVAHKKFQPGELIIEHVADNHSWHILGEGHNSVSLPLPVIVYNKDRGFTCFSSSHFHHGEMAHDGYMLKGNDVVAVNEMEDTEASLATVNPDLTSVTFDISITKNVASLFLSLIILVWMIMSVAKSYTRRQGQAPKGIQSLLEPIIIFVRDDVAKASIGPKYQKYLPYLLTVFFFIWINNLLGIIPIIPGGANVTGNLAITGTLAVITFVITSISANKHYWRHVFAMPGVPVWVLVILTPIEILSLFLRPFVLMIRLFANMAAGHIIALSFFSLIFIFGEMSAVAGWSVSIVSVAFVIFMTVLELLVAFLQAYVFTLLSAIYFGAAVEEHHEHHVHENDHVMEASIA
jgi:F-type H+-transporting ATPase subunit a